MNRSCYMYIGYAVCDAILCIQEMLYYIYNIGNHHQYVNRRSYA